MPKQSLIGDQEILEAALVGYQSQLGQIDDAIAGIRSRLGIRGPRPLVMSTDGAQPTPTKRRMSAAARRRISLAQKKRWAATRTEKPESQKPAAKPKRRKMSKAGRAAIIAATKKRWAAFHRAQKAAA
jgi:hypothetical protein